MGIQLITYLWAISFPMTFCDNVYATGKVPPSIGEKKTSTESLAGDFDFLLKLKRRYRAFE